MNNFLLLKYRDLPNVDFICECETGIRIKVSVKERSDIHSFAAGVLYGIVEPVVFIFENISAGFKPAEELKKAIYWYKRFKGLYKMQIFQLIL